MLTDGCKRLMSMTDGWHAQSVPTLINHAVETSFCCGWHVQFQSQSFMLLIERELVLLWMACANPMLLIHVVEIYFVSVACAFRTQIIHVVD
jgi:hypothetical protein